MTRRKKITLVLFALIVISQAPFLYRRIRLGGLQKRIDDLRAERMPPGPPDEYKDFRGVIHVHSRLGGHSTSDPGDVITSARTNGLAFVVMTEHGPPDSYTASAALEGLHQGVLFIDGSEVVSADGGRLLIIPATSPGFPQPRTTQAGISYARSRGKLVFIAYPEGRPLADLKDYNGIEIFNANTQTRRINKPRLLFDTLWSYRSYAHLLMTQLYFRPDENLQAWDHLSARNRKLTAISGVDAHANIGLAVQTHASQVLGSVVLDPFDLTFQIVRNYVVLPRDRLLDTPAVMDALEGGQIYTAFEIMANASGFRFTAANDTMKVVMGQEIPLNGGVTLNVVLPKYGRIVLFCNGNPIQETSTVGHHKFTVHGRGSYRIEVYLDRLEKPLSDHPWIISNPIYVR